MVDNLTARLCGVLRDLENHKVLIEGKTEIRELHRIGSCLGRLDRRQDPAVHSEGSRLGRLQDEISDTTESASQRAWLKEGRHSVKLLGQRIPSQVTWLDMELPVSADPENEYIIDLLGHASDGGHVVCELKYSRRIQGSREKGSHGPNSPALAVVKCMMYAAMIRENIDYLRQYGCGHPCRGFSWDEIDPTQLTCWVAANAGYWHGWFGNRPTYNTAFWDFFKKQGLGSSVLLFRTIDIDFEGQKGRRKKYVPQVPQNGHRTWEQLTGDPS